MTRGILAGALFGILTAAVIVVLVALVVEGRRQAAPAGEAASDQAFASDAAAEAGDPSGQQDPRDDWLLGIEQILGQ